MVSRLWQKVYNTIAVKKSKTSDGIAFRVYVRRDLAKLSCVAVDFAAVNQAGSMRTLSLNSKTASSDIDR